MAHRFLFTRGEIGALSIRNRIAMPAIHLGMADGGLPSPDLIRFYERRAEGGVGAITVGVCDTWGVPSKRLAGALALSRDDCTGPMADLAAGIKVRGAAAGVQLSPIAGYNDPAWSPGPERVPEMIASFASAARRAEEAGFDFVEIMLSGGGLLSHFLSPVHNDWAIEGYGDGLEQRLRAPIEVVAAAREATGGRIPILARIHGHEFLEGGHGIEESVAVAAALAEAGVDALNVTGGGHRAALPQITRQTPPLAFAHLAFRAREATGLPILTGGRIRTPAEAERLLDSGSADFVNLGRAILADPDWPSKAESGGAETIVPCTACGGCFDRAVSGRPVRCSLSPGEPPKSAPESRKRVLVVGSGPAGLQSAWTLHRMGHRVTLWEKEEEIGGRWRTASLLYGGADLGAALYAFTARLARAGVQVETGVEATSESVRAFGPDALVLATGSVPRKPEIPGLDEHPRVLLADEVPRSAERVGGDVAIVGAGGVGVALAVHLAGRGEPDLRALGFLARYGTEGWMGEALASGPARRVTLIRRRGYAGKGLGRSVRWALMLDLERLGVRTIDRAVYERVAPDGIHLIDGRTEEAVFAKADTIVIACGYEPERGLAERWADAAPSVVVVGDAGEVGNIGAAVSSAHEACASL